MHEGIKPAIAGTVRITEAEAMTSILVKVKLDRPTRFEPGLDNTKLASEKKIIAGDHIEHWRSILRHLNRAYTTIDRTDEVQFHGPGVKCGMHRETRAGRKADHAQPPSRFTAGTFNRKNYLFGRMTWSAAMNRDETFAVDNM
ncbi:MAG TPA: hypothetical protein VK666_03850 [Chryseolinea sp.]|nr:hypothetical protein [Chryseolinea sp.]